MGGFHAAAISSEGRVFTWGSNDVGRLGDGTTTNRLIPTHITNNFNLGLEETITYLSLGTYHSSIVTSEGQAFIWGYNNDSQLGDDTTSNKTLPTKLSTTSPKPVHQETYVYSSNIVPYSPTLQGYTLSGWYTDINLAIPYVFTTMPDSDLVLFGKWTVN